MRNRALLEAQAKLLLEQLNELEALDAKFGADDYPIGSVLLFDRVWENTGKRYEFAAIKVYKEDVFGGRPWYVTKGDNSRMGAPFSWEGLKEFAKTTTKLYYVSEWTEVFDDAQ